MHVGVDGVRLGLHRRSRGPVQTHGRSCRPIDWRGSFLVSASR